MREAHNSKFKIQNDNNKNGWQFAPSELSTIFFENILPYGLIVVDLR